MNTSFIEDTIAAPATIPGTGAITVIRVSGPECFTIADKVLKLRSGSVSSSKPNSVHYGVAAYPDGRELDDVMTSVFKAPHSYTGEDSVEISCHASRYIADELMKLLCDAGARPAGPGEFTRRAFINGKMDLAQAEAVADIISSNSSASLRVAMNQLRGGFSSELQQIRADMLQMTSLLELELDFSEEDVEFADRSKLASMIDSVSAHIRKLTESFRYGNAIRNGVPVAIVGAVNAGKSTLLNALLGDDRAIVSDIAGTTRDTVEETLVINGILFRLIDTAGIRETSDTVESIGISRSYKKISEASVVLALLDSTASEDENAASLKDLVSRVDLTFQKLLILINKTDKIGTNSNVTSINKLVSLYENKLDTLEISAKTGLGLDKLKSWLSESQKDLSAASDQTIVTNMRHYNELTAVLKSLEDANAAIGLKVTPDLLAEDLRQSLYHLGAIVGEVTPDEVLGNIFSHFCIGK